eukprot:2589020-Pyramimonas_sp.AAC.1
MRTTAEEEEGEKAPHGGAPLDQLAHWRVAALQYQKWQRRIVRDWLRAIRERQREAKEAQAKAKANK